MASNVRSIQEINRMSFEEFITTFSNVIEHCQLIAAAVCVELPFMNVDHIQDGFSRFVDRLPTEGRAGILRCHPDLAGKLALQHSLTKESTSEQASAGLHLMSDNDRNTMNLRNKQYKDKFGFPFVICARENKVASILEGLKTRLLNSYEDEINTGVREVKKICYLRICNIVECDKSSKL